MYITRPLCFGTCVALRLYCDLDGTRIGGDSTSLAIDGDTGERGDDVMDGITASEGKGGVGLSSCWLRRCWLHLSLIGGDESAGVTVVRGTTSASASAFPVFSALASTTGEGAPRTDVEVVGSSPGGLVANTAVVSFGA